MDSTNARTVAINVESVPANTELVTTSAGPITTNAELIPTNAESNVEPTSINTESVSTKEQENVDSEVFCNCNNIVEVMLFGNRDLSKMICPSSYGSDNKTHSNPKDDLNNMKLKQQSLYTMWNIIRFLVIGLFVFFAAHKKQRSLDNFYDNSKQCCYCLINEREHNEIKNLRMEWSVCEKNFGDIFCGDSSDTYKIGNMCHESERYSCESSLMVVKWHKAYNTYGTATLIMVILYVVILYIVTRCYSSLGIYIVFYNILVSMGCLYWLLQVFQFSKKEEYLTDNSYKRKPECYQDDFASPLRKMLTAFLITTMSFALFPILLFLINVISAFFCNHGDSWYHKSCQTFNSFLRRFGATFYVIFTFAAAITFFACLLWGLIIICKPRDSEEISSVATVIIALLAVASWSDIYFIGYFICICKRCGCDSKIPWFCRTETHEFCGALKQCLCLSCCSSTQDDSSV